MTGKITEQELDQFKNESQTVKSKINIPGAHFSIKANGILYPAIGAAHAVSGRRHRLPRARLFNAPVPHCSIVIPYITAP